MRRPIPHTAPLERRVSAAVVALVALGLALVGLLVVARVHDHVRSAGEQSLRRTLAAAAAGLPGRPPEVAGVRFAGISPGGVASGDLALARLVRGHRPSTFRAGSSTVVVEHVTRASGVATIAAATRAPDRLDRELLWIEAQGLIPIGICLVGLAIWLFERAARRHRGRLEALGDAAGRIGAGDYTARLGEGSDDEIGRLASTFDSLADTLELLEHERGTYVASVSHDLRNPLTLIRAYAFALRRGEGSDARLARLETIEHEVDRLSTMVDDLRLTGRMHGLARTVDAAVCELAELVESFASRQRPVVAGYGLSLEVSVPHDPIEAFADAARIEQLLQNLTDNAVRHCASGGEIRIELSRTGSSVEIAVEDSGSGLEGQGAELFLPGTQGANPGHRGLGLAICHAIADGHGGELSAGAGARLGGARFVFRLPLHRAAVPADR